MHVFTTRNREEASFTAMIKDSFTFTTSVHEKPARKSLSAFRPSFLSAPVGQDITAKHIF